MNQPLKMVKIGEAVGVVLPEELVARLNGRPGAMLSVAATEKGIELSPYEPDFETQMAAAREVMARRRRALAELAK